MAWDRYAELEFIGAGGMGEVWKAYDRDTGAVVALKKLRATLARPKDMTRFRREIRHLGNVKHPNVIRLAAVAPVGTDPAYAMEYCPDGDLVRWLRKPRSLEEKLTCFAQVFAGVAALHESPHQIVHRDLKPSNILLGVDGRFKVSDLGLSISLLDDETRPTTSNWVSPGFSPPEQYRDMRNVTQAGDVFSLGAVLFYLLSGKDAQYVDDLDSTSIPSALPVLLRKMLASEPGERFRSAKSLPGLIQDSLLHEDATVFPCPKCGSPALSWDSTARWVYKCHECGEFGWEGAA